MNYWLMKSEPTTYGIDTLKKERKTGWDGVRNYQARNFMQKEMNIGDLVIFYHSNCKPPGAAGIARVSKKAYPDPTALDPKSPYYDPKATKEKPIWHMVEVEFVEEFPHYVSLPEIKTEESLKEMLLLRKGMRLSIQPITAAHFKKISSMGNRS